MVNPDEPADFVSQSADPAELAQFAQHARHWWDREGPFAPLHRINPARMDYIRNQAIQRLRLRGGLQPLAGLKALDIEYLPSQANFILSKPGDGRGLFTELQKQGIITRALGPSLAPYLRLSVGTEEENHRLLTALEKTRTVFGA